MSNNTKIKYNKFCEENDKVPIFSKGWWLDAICGPENWDVCIYEKGGETVGAWPYFVTSKFNQQMLTMPPLTKFLGIYIKYPKNLKASAKISFEKEVITALFEQLPYNHINQNFHYNFKNWLPLLWKGFSQSTAYSYYIDEQDTTEAYSQFKSSTRREIKKAQKTLEIFKSKDVDILYDLVSKTYSAKSKPAPYSSKLLTSLTEASHDKQVGEILYAKDKENNIHAGVYFVWDDENYYYLIGGSNQQFKGSHANSLLIWHGIQNALNSKKVFDFEGSMIPSIEHYFRSFGALQRPYFNIKHSRPLWLKFYFSLKALR